MQDPMGQSAAAAASAQFPSLQQAVANGQLDGGGRSVTPTPSSAAAAAVAAVAQGLRQQMCGLAAPGGDGQQGPSSAAVAALASALLGREADNQAATVGLNNNNLGLRGGHHHQSMAISSMAAFQKQPLYQRPDVYAATMDDAEHEAAAGGHAEPDDGLKTLDAPPAVAE